MQATSLNPKQKGEVRAQVSQFLAKSQAFSGLSPSQREQVIADTGKVVEAMAEGRAASDPYAIAADSAGGGRVSTAGGQIGQQIGTTAGNLLQKQVAPTGSIIDVGVQEAAKMIREINFPDFVAKLIEGTFHAIVKSSIEQMRAYADMVRSVSTSLNDFRDRNTTENQARDHLASQYPSLLAVVTQNGQPRVTLKDGADTENLPDFQKDL